MDNDFIFLVRKRDGQSEPYRRAVLKEDLVTAFGLAPADADAFTRALELDVLRRKKEVVESSAIKRLVYDFKAKGPIALAIERLSNDEFGPGRQSSEPAAPAVRTRREFARRGPTAPVWLAIDSQATLVEDENEPLARVIRHLHEVAATCVNDAVREKTDALVDLLDSMSFASDTLKGSLRRSIRADTAYRHVRAPMQAALIAGLADLKETGIPLDPEVIAAAKYDAAVANLRRRGSELLPDDFKDDLAEGEVYRMVASLERKGADKPLRGTDWPLYCFERVDPQKDDLDGGELTIQRLSEASLYTDDLNAAREFVSTGWNAVTEFANDLPQAYRKSLDGIDTIGVQSWFLLERSTAGSILDEIFVKIGNELEAKEREIKASAENKFGAFLADLATAAPFPVPDSFKKAAGQLAGGVAGWLIDLIIELLDTKARPFPSVQIIHNVFWPAGRKPLSQVVMSTRESASGEYRQTRFAYFREHAPNGIGRYSDNLDSTLVWFGASQPAPQAPSRIFRNTAESTETAVFWRPTDGKIAPAGFGVTVRQQNFGNPKAIYVPMLRSDLRKVPDSDSVSGTGVVDGQ